MHSLAARSAVRLLRSSKIREVANTGMGKKDVVAFWFGEPDEVTPDFIRQAGIEALNRGETFYTENLGIPELRDAIGNYLSRLHRRGETGHITAENVAVTSSGMSALMLTTQSLVGPGDRVVVVTPVSNLVEIPRFSVPKPSLSLNFTPKVDARPRAPAGALEPGTRAVYINSPNNPTG
jgi:aspartate/methionine/tyrosine aminotransferase